MSFLGAIAQGRGQIIRFWPWISEKYTPPKTHMDRKNHGFQEESPFQVSYSTFRCHVSFSGGAISTCNELASRWCYWGATFATDGLPWNQLRDVVCFPTFPTKSVKDCPGICCRCFLKCFLYVFYNGFWTKLREDVCATVSQFNMMQFSVISARCAGQSVAFMAVEIRMTRTW